jgi:Arc/MetJ-type ribon-helix-helix transcriptional regulator
MNIQLPKDLERFVHDAVRDGRYVHEDDVIRDALSRLQRAMAEPGAKPARGARRTKPAGSLKKPLTEKDLQQHMLDIGLMSRLPDTDADFDDPDDQLVEIKGEPLSETIIRERR